MECIYCGDVATCKDHIIPCSYLGVRTYGTENNLVPACSTCNSLLGSVTFLEDSLERKAQYLVGAYKKKYAKLLKTPEWDEAELDDMTGSLRASVLHQQMHKQQIKARIEYIQLKAAWLSELAHRCGFDEDTA